MSRLVQPDTDATLLPSSEPRIISNLIGDESTGTVTASPKELSLLFTIFGQFLDHDLSLDTSPSDGTAETADIIIPDNDQFFTPGSSLSFRRSYFETDAEGRRQHVSVISPWLDCGNIYGSSDDIAASLRSNVDGKLLTTEGDRLPLNGIFYTAGDVRANENAILTSLHTIWMRYHNKICDDVKRSRDGENLSDDELYTTARNFVIGVWQKIVFEEWLPALIGNFNDYSGYDATIDPALDDEFSTAAFRFGHALLSGDIPSINRQGNTEETYTL